MLDNFDNNTYSYSISWLQISDGSSVIRYMYISYFIHYFPHFPNGSVALYDCNEIHDDLPFTIFPHTRF